MKSVFIGFLIALCSRSNSTAATVVLQFDCTIDSVVSGTPPPIGISMHVRIIYDSLREGYPEQEPDNTAFISYWSTIVTVGEKRYLLDYMEALIGRNSDGLSWRLKLLPHDFLSPQGSNREDMEIFFQSTEKFFNDTTRLPESFSEWNLPATDFNMTFETRPLDRLATGDVEAWKVASRTISNLSLGIVPEPSVAALAFFGIALCGCRGKLPQQP